VRRPAAILTALFAIAFLVLSLPGPVEGATIEGRVIHPKRAEAGARLTVDLLGVNRAGQSIEQTTKTDATGQFAFRGLPSSAAYVLSATYEGVRFPGGSVVFEPGKPETRSVVFHIYDPTGERAIMEVRSLRLVIQREAGIYRAQQSVLISNPTLEALVIKPDDPPLFRVALPQGHGSIQAPFGRLPQGTEVRDGTLAIRGPLHPGEHTFTVAFDLPSDGDALQTEFSVADPLRELEVSVRDFGIRVDAGALHPGRPAREGDSIYLRYLGFDLPAGTRLPFRVEPLPPTTTPPPWVQGLLVLAVGGGLLFLVYLPVEGAAGATQLPVEVQSEGEREAITDALSDLEHDFETGKLSAEDRDRLRAELRREAVLTLARARRSAETVKSEPPSTCSCGRPFQPGDRFCASCGKTL
jgi:hypothetical protein